MPLGPVHEPFPHPFNRPSRLVALWPAASSFSRLERLGRHDPGPDVSSPGAHCMGSVSAGDSWKAWSRCETREAARTGRHGDPSVSLLYSVDIVYNTAYGHIVFI